MGQQQLLLLILATIIVGIAVAGGIVLFRGGAVSAARDAVALDLEDLGTKAQLYYRRPTSMGGGGRTFAISGGSTIINISYLMPRLNPYPSPGQNNNGRYFIDPAPNSTLQRLKIIGIGKEVVGTDTVEVWGFVTADSISLVKIY